MTDALETGRIRIVDIARPLCALLALLVCGCATTDGANRDRLAAEAMALDQDESLQVLRLKMEAAREASLGGYGEASAGGCGCQ